MQVEKIELPKRDLEFVLESFETIEAELEALELSEEWFTSDSMDRLISAKQILYSALGIQEEDYDDEDFEQASLELHFDE